MDDARLREPENLFGKDYFEDQLERIRDIRSSECRFYQKSRIFTLSAVFRCSAAFSSNRDMLEKAAFDVIRQASEENVIYTEEIRRNNFKIYVAKTVRTSAIMYV